MYLFDPAGGRKRRALLRDKAVHSAHLAGSALNVSSRDLLHRAGGAVSRATVSRLRHRDLSDQAILARVRSRLGHHVQHVHAVDVNVLDGQVVLRGKILPQELGEFLASIEKIPGVRKITHQLRTADPSEFHDSPVLHRREGGIKPAGRLLVLLGGVGLSLVLLRQRFYARHLDEEEGGPGYFDRARDVLSRRRFLH